MREIVNIILNIIYRGLEYYGRYYSKYRGLVVDRNDPKGQGRLKINVHGIVPGGTDWVPGSGIYSGGGYGAHAIPQQGDLVWVSFENGDPTKPVWEYGYFGNGEMSGQMSDPNNYWFITPGGHKVELNDTSGDITIENSKGDIITMNSKGVSIKTKKIFLGSVDEADEPAVLGDTLQKKLAAMMTQIGALSMAASALGSGLSSAMSNMTKAGTNQWTAALITSMNAASLEASKTAKTFSEKTGSINEGLNNLAKTLPSIKSKKVRLDK